MISGVVNENLESIAHLQLRGPSGQTQETEAIIDTGFNGYLTVSSALAARLGLLRIGRSRVRLASGREEVLDLYEIEVLWDGQWQTVESDAADTEPLVGMSLAYGYRICVETIENGRVVIEHLP